MFAFLTIRGKKTSLFSTAVVTPKPQYMTNLTTKRNKAIQEGKAE